MKKNSDMLKIHIRVYTYLFCFRLLQRDGVNNSMIGKISKRPISILKDSTILEIPENPEKLPIGPTNPKPGPTLLRQVTTAVSVVSKSNSSIDTIKKEENKINAYIVK